MSKKTQSNPTSASNNAKYNNPPKVFVPDSEDGEANDIEIVQRQKKALKKLKNKKIPTNNGIVTTTQIPNNSKKLQIKPEENLCILRIVFFYLVYVSEDNHIHR